MKAVLYSTFLGALVCLGIVSTLADRSFVVDYANDRFLKDGKPFRYISGSIHYSRTPAEYWPDRLAKAYAAGLDAVQFYVPWNFHEIEPGVFDFSGDHDLERYLQQIQDAGLLAIVRLGPYICAEWDFGGFPAWLLQKNQSIALRTSDPVYMGYVASWFSELLRRVSRFAYSRGGPIIMVQIENEYGSFGACDRNYMRFLYTMTRQAFGEQMVIFTTDGCGDGYLKCGALTDPDAFALPTVDFGPGGDPAGCFAVQRKYIPGGHGPGVNSEYYTGWLDNWGNPHSRTDSHSVTAWLEAMLALNQSASVNMYMFAGGTNFGYNNGANSPPFSPQPTSYDYDAPISEAGDTTWKYQQVRATIAKFKPLPNVTVPANTTKTAYGRVTLPHSVTLAEYIASSQAAASAIHSMYPLSFEELGLAGGFMVYKSEATGGSTFPAGTLQLNGVHDRAYVFHSADWSLFGVIYRGKTSGKDPVTTLHVPAARGFFILVESFGHVNYGGNIIGDRKGLVLNVSLVPDSGPSASVNPVMLTNWTMYPLTLEKTTQSLKAIVERKARERRTLRWSVAQRSVMRSSKSASGFVPTFYANDPQAFSISGVAHDTFARIDGGWRKGQLLINGRNLGRYWPVVGPQVTLFVPAVALNASNSVWLFELEGSPCGSSSSLRDSRYGKRSRSLRYQSDDDSTRVNADCAIEFIDTPILDGPTKFNTPLTPKFHRSSIKSD